MDKYGQAHYDLEEIKGLLDDPRNRIITRSSRRGAVSLGYASDDDMVFVVKKLKKSDIFKTMQARNAPGLWQDVYHTNDKDVDLYIKLQKSACGKGVIISFKEKT